MLEVIKFVFDIIYIMLMKMLALGNKARNSNTRFFMSYNINNLNTSEL